MEYLIIRDEEAEEGAGIHSLKVGYTVIKPRVSSFSMQVVCTMRLFQHKHHFRDRLKISFAIIDMNDCPIAAFFEVIWDRSEYKKVNIFSNTIDLSVNQRRVKAIQVFVNKIT